MTEELWTWVATTDDLGVGEGFETEADINGEIIGLFCIDGEYYALGECPHEQGPLCQGIIEGNEVTCPWHSAKFNILTGQCIAGPSACRVSGAVGAGIESDEGDTPAANRYDVKVEGKDIFVRKPAN